MGSRSKNSSAFRSCSVSLTKNYFTTKTLSYQYLNPWSDCTDCSGTPLNNGDTGLSGTVLQGGSYDTNAKLPVRDGPAVMPLSVRLCFRLDCPSITARDNAFGVPMGDWNLDLFVVQHFNNEGYNTTEMAKMVNESSNIYAQCPSYGNSMTVTNSVNTPKGIVMHRERRVIRRKYCMRLYGYDGYTAGFPVRWLEHAEHHLDVWEVVLRPPKDWLVYNGDGMSPGFMETGHFAVYAMLTVAGHYEEGDSCHLSCTATFDYLNQ